MAKVGYARVSSVGQSLDVQREKLGGCDKLFEEKRSGTTDARPMLKQCLGYVREGDQVIVTRIDRLARSTLHLCQIAETLRKKGVDLVVLDQNIDTSDATGRLLFNMLGAIGQFETQIRAERQMDRGLRRRTPHRRHSRSPDPPRPYPRDERRKLPVAPEQNRQTVILKIPKLRKGWPAANAPWHASAIWKAHAPGCAPKSNQVSSFAPGH